ncbi:MAG TPA: MFS transporter, partial [Vicinamibacteria bacterium]
MPRIPTLAGLEGNLWKLAALRFLCFTHFMSAVIIPFFRDWGGLSYVQIFALQTWFMVMSFLMEVPTGTVADRFGRKVSVASGAFLLAAASLLYGSLPHLAVFVVAEAVFAVAVALISGADEALAYDSLLALGREGEASRVMARLEAAKLAGILVGALVGSVVAARLGVRWPMVLQAAPLAAGGLVALTLVEPPRTKKEPAEGGSFLRLLSGGLHHFREAPALRALALDQVACATVAWLVIWLYQLQLARVGVPLAAYGVVHAAMGLGQIALLSRVAAVERAVGGKARLARLTALVPALAMLGLAATTSVPASLALIVAAATAGLTRPPLFSGPVNRLIPSERRATVLS